MRIGIVDLDTSHPQNWIPIERDLGHEIIGVWDGGSVHPRAYVEQFAKDHGIPRVFDSIEDLAAEAECAIIHGCDWDTHIVKARPFVEAGKSVLIDKPMAGNVRDLDQIRDWVRGGARISGGSSLRFCVETQEWLGRPVEERGVPKTVFCGCGVDEFNYGIHAYAMASGILGAGARRVRHVEGNGQRRVLVTWDDGRVLILAVGKTDNWLPFHATIVTERTVTHFQADAGKLYRALLEAVLPYLAGETATPPLPIDALLEPELCAVAARFSWMHGNTEVALDYIDASDNGYDGRAFATEYRQARYPAA